MCGCCCTFTLLQQGGDHRLVLYGVEGAGGVHHPPAHGQLFHAADRDTQLQPRDRTHTETHTQRMDYSSTLQARWASTGMSHYIEQYALPTPGACHPPVEVQTVRRGPLLPHVYVLPHCAISAEDRNKNRADQSNGELGSSTARVSETNIPFERGCRGTNCSRPSLPASPSSWRGCVWQRGSEPGAPL